ncbi:hypothetical protein KJ763_01360 [Patescibacteria group bacterium]|nr:hypothetical protein [Patescibacteria group bacterium]
MIGKGGKGRGLLEIVKVMMYGNGNNNSDIQQRIIEKLAEILSIRSCIIFRTFLHKEERQLYCKITAGVPKDDHGVGLEELLDKHPDVKHATSQKQRFIVIKNPCENELCSYFKSTIERRKISEILYIPLLVEVEGSPKTKGAIVIDKRSYDGREFNEEEIEFCCQVAELIAMLITYQENIFDEIRDKILNKVVSIGGFGKKLKKASDQLAVVLEDVKKIEDTFSKEI